MLKVAKEQNLYEISNNKFDLEKAIINQYEDRIQIIYHNNNIEDTFNKIKEIRTDV